MSAPLTVRILGCGSSGGVPRLGANGADWGACDPANPRNKRTRCSILVSRGEARVLVDASPDMREQLIAARCGKLDGVLFTHDHADQCHGVDDLRMVAQAMGKRVDIHADAMTMAGLKRRFGYCFETPEGNGYPPIITGHEIAPLRAFEIAGVPVLPFDQDHGTMRTLGFRFGPVAYTSDAVAIPEASFAALSGIECWIVDALRYRPHPTHANVEMALSWIQRVRPNRAILTNLHADLDFVRLARELPEGVEPAYDGLEISLIG